MVQLGAAENKSCGAPASRRGAALRFGASAAARLEAAGRRRRLRCARKNPGRDQSYKGKETAEKSVEGMIVEREVCPAQQGGKKERSATKRRLW